MKYKTQYDEAVSVNHDALANLKLVCEEISKVLKMFLEEDAPAVDSAQTIEEHRPWLTKQVQSISSKMVKYIRSSIHASVVWTVTIIKLWYPRQDMQCLLEGANPDVTDDQLAKYQASAEPIADQLCEDLGWGKE